MTAGTNTHQFRLGQQVAVTAPDSGRLMPNGPFEVTERFCHRGEPFYCVKSPNEPYERVLAESRLRATHDCNIAVDVGSSLPSHELRFDRLHHELMALSEPPKIIH
jgi:hypothetical protein